MKGFYARWIGLILIGLVIIVLGTKRYYQEVHSLTPEAVLGDQPEGTVRVTGRVEAGTLAADPDSREADFILAGDRSQIRVHYQGEWPDNLRELKTLVVVGRWNASPHEFEAREIDLIPNTGFIIGAYFVLIPTALFLFLMQRKVRLLYTKIKGARPYESEIHELDEG